ncbi:diguanylate cyclase [Clostridium thailandense]|uniref:diguanylate cyclase n=1 Tax=Clostridium thailandense TaxID=2794346 RepID=UPI00398902AC
MCGCGVEKNNIPKSSQGTIDLTNWDFKKDGLAKLDGQWELYWGQLLEPKDFKSNHRNKPNNFINLPNSLITTVNNNILPKFGYGTMRIIIKMKANGDKLYGIKTQHILSASKIWINGQLVSSAGLVSKDENSAIESFEHQMAFFKNDNNDVEIVIQMSNFNNVSGKIQSIFLGNANQVKREYITSAASDAFVIGCIFIMGIYHFVLYYKRPKYKAPLYFGIFCLVIALRNTLVGERIIFDIFPNIPFTLFNKIAYLTVYFSLPFIAMFFKELFAKDISSKMIHVTQIVSLFISLVTICTNIEIYEAFLIYYEVYAIILFIYILFIVVKAVINNTQGALIILFGFIVFLATVVHDAILHARLLNTNSLIPLGFFIFIFSQAYMLATKFSNAFLKIEKLVEENKSVYIDELTGILNRRGFYEQGDNLFKATSTTGGKFTLFYGDLNRLKTINDSFGHKEGDEAIKNTAQIFKNSFAESDIVARMSGDEFVAIAVNKASEEESKKIIELINSNFYKYNLISKKPYKLSISMGYSMCIPSTNTTFKELLHKADTMLYEAKIMITNS